MRLHKELATKEQILELIPPYRVGLIIQMRPRRLGVRAFLTFFETRHFPLGTLPEFDLWLRTIVIEHVLFGVISIPQAKLPEADAQLKELGLRRANGIPHFIVMEKGKTQVCRFPVDAPNLFTIENLPHHFIYKNDQTLHKTAEQMEDEACERELAKYETAGRAVDPRLTETACPLCHHLLNYHNHTWATEGETVRAIEPGDLVVCYHCQGFLKLNDKFQCEILTMAEYDALPAEAKNILHATLSKLPK